MRRMRESGVNKDKDGMQESSPRGIAVVDVGFTNTKIALFSPKGELLAERKGPSRHVPGPPYLHIDPEPMVALCRTARSFYFLDWALTRKTSLLSALALLLARQYC